MSATAGVRHEEAANTGHVLTIAEVTGPTNRRDKRSATKPASQPSQTKSDRKSRHHSLTDFRYGGSAAPLAQRG
jgi:hypothetical protein